MSELLTFQELVRRFSDLYVSYRGRYVVSMNGRMYIPHYGDSDATCKLTDAVIAGHLNRRYAVAVYGGAHSSKFVCFDVDLNDKAVVRKVVDGLTQFGFPKDHIYVSTSGGKGYHVEMFFTDLVYTNYLIDLYETVCEEGKLDRRKVEFRPTAKQSIKLPLSIHGKTGNVCWYLDQETLEPIKDIYYVMKIQRLDRDWVTELIKKKRRFEMLDCPEMHGEDAYPKGNPVKVTRFGNEFPMLLEKGTRHNLMVGIGVAQRYLGVAQEDIVKRLMEWAENQNGDLIGSSKEEVEEDAEKIAAWVWGPRFGVTQAKNVYFTEYDIRRVRNLRGQTKKKVLFLLIAFCRKFQLATLSAKRIAEYVGASERGVVKAISCLEEAGIITHLKGKSIMHNGKKILTPNRYKYSEDGNLFCANHFPLDWDFKEGTFDDVFERVMSGGKKNE